MNIIIYGAGKTGQYLARTMSSEGNDIIVIEKNPELCVKLRGYLDATVIESQGIKGDVFNTEMFKNCDLFIAVSSVDEMNIISCSAAKKVGAKRAVARVRNNDLNYLDKLIDINYFGIDLIIHPEK